MAGVGELLAAVRGVLAAMDSARASMVEAVLRADEAARIAANATAGPSRPEVRAIAAEYRQGAETVRAAVGVLERIAGDLRAYVASLEGDGPVSTPRVTGAATVPVRREERGEDPRVVAARERLPPPVTRGRGQKTRGEWFTGSGGGSGEVSSGRDALSERANEVLRESGTPPGLPGRRQAEVVKVNAYYKVAQGGPIPVDENGIDSLVDSVVADASEAGVPVAAMLEWPGPDGLVVLQFGVRPDGRTGFVGHITKPESVVSHNGDSPGIEVDYDYMGGETPLDASAEIDFAEVRRAVRAFVTQDGTRDEFIAWRILTARSAT